MPASRKVHALIAAVAGGNTQAFEELYRLSCPKLYGLALRVLRQSDLAASAMRRAFIQVRADAHRHSPQEDPVGFLVARLRAATFDIARTGAGIDAWEPFEVDNPARDPLALGGRSLALTRLLTCLGALPEERRRMVLLAYYDGWSREALAIVFDAPVPAVRALIARSTDQIADCLGKKPPPAFSDVDRHMAAEYALGTLDAEERTAVRAQMEQAPEFGKLVRQWERRLAPLHELAAPVAPPPGLWTAIAGDLRRQPGAAIAPRVPVAAMPAGGASGAGAPDAAALAVSPEGRAPGRAGTSARPAGTRKQGLFSFMLERVMGRPSTGASRGRRGSRPAPLPIPVVAIPPAPPVAAEAEFAAAEEPLPLLSPVPPPPRRSAAVQRHPVRSAVSPKAPSGPPLDAEARAAAFRALAEAIDLRIGAAEDASTGLAAPPAPEAPPAVDAKASPAVDPAPAAQPDEAARAAAFRLLAEVVDLRIGAAEDASTGQAAPPAPEAPPAVDATASPAADPVPAAQPDAAARAAAFRVLAETVDLRIGVAEDASTGQAAPPAPEAPPAGDATASPAVDPAPAAQPDEAARAAAFRLLAEAIDLRIGGDGEAAAETSGAPEGGPAAAPDVQSSAPAPAPAVAGPAAPDDAARAAAFRALAEAIDLRIGSADGTPPAPAALSGSAQAEEADAAFSDTAAARLVAPEGAAAVGPAEAAAPVAGDGPPASAGTATIAETGAEGGPEGGGAPPEPRAAAGALDAVTGGPSQAVGGDSATLDPPGATAASLPVPCDPPQGTFDAVSVVAGSQVAGAANAPASAGAVGAAAEAAVEPARERHGASPSGAEVASLAAEAPQPGDGLQAASASLPAAEDGRPDEARPASDGAAPLHDASAPAADPVPAPDGPAINLSDAPTPHAAEADLPCAAGDGAAIVQAAEGSEPAAVAPASGDPASDAPGQDGSTPARHPGMMDAVPGAEDADLPFGGAAGTSASIDHLPPTSAMAGEDAAPPQPVPAASALHGLTEPQVRSGELGPADPQAEAAPAQPDETDAALAKPGAAPAERADVLPATAATAASPAADSAAAATVLPTGVAEAAPAAVDGEGPSASAAPGDAEETASAVPASAEMSADVASVSLPATGAGAAPVPPDAMPGAPPPAASSPADAVPPPADAASANGPEVSPDPAGAGPQPIVLPPPVFKSAGPGAPAAPTPPSPEAEAILPPEILAASLARWRRATVVLSALVVALGAYGLHRTLWPVSGDRYVSVLQREPSPALSIRLDPQDGVVRVQVLAPDLPAGGRYALWLVTEKSGTHLISRFSGSTVAHSAALKRVGKAGLANATLTVTVEPAEAAVVPLAPGANVVYRGRLAPE